MAVHSKENTLRIIMGPMQEAMLAADITPELLARKLREELEANETRFFAHQERWCRLGS
jgi:hypothetical protein